jgi:hypothetical protein
MAWIDKPTKAQINALYLMIRWHMSTVEVNDALDWLEQNATRKQVSDELSRIRDLKLSRKLDRDGCFRGEVWSEYFNSRKEKVTNND